MRLKRILHCLQPLIEGQPSKLMLSTSLVLGQSAVGPIVPERTDGSTLVSALCSRARAPPPSNGKVEDDITEGCPAALPVAPSRVTLLGSGQKDCEGGGTTKVCVVPARAALLDFCQSGSVIFQDLYIFAPTRQIELYDLSAQPATHR